MNFDVRTVTILISLCAFAMGGGLFFIAGDGTSVGKLLRKWALASFAHSIGWGLLAARDSIPDVLSIVVANSLLLLALLVNFYLLREFCDRPRYKRWFACVPITVLALVFWTYVQPNINARIVWMSLSSAVILMLCSATLLRFCKRTIKADKEHETSRAALSTAWGYAFCAAVMLIRAGVTLWTYEETHALFAVNSFNDFYFCAMLFNLVLLTFGFLGMNHERTSAELRRLATIDLLTGIWNRGTVERLARQTFENSRRADLPFSVLLCDIDHFKRINDTLGHQGGDVALLRVVKILKDNLRGGDQLGRYGGEEFLIVAPGTDAEGALVLAEWLRQSVERDAGKVSARPITLSFGVATFNSGMGDCSELLRLADNALYAAKHAGRNRVEVASRIDKSASKNNEPFFARPSDLGAQNQLDIVKSSKRDKKIAA